MKMPSQAYCIVHMIGNAERCVDREAGCLEQRHANKVASRRGSNQAKSCPERTGDCCKWKKQLACNSRKAHLIFLTPYLSFLAHRTRSCPSSAPNVVALAKPPII